MEMKVVSVESRPDDKSSATPSDTTEKSSFVCELSRPWYVLALTCVYSLYALCAVYFVAAGWVYEYLKTSFLAMSLEYLELTLRHGAYRPVAIIHWVIGCVFVLMIIIPLSSLLITTHYKRKDADPSRVSSRKSSISEIKTATTSFLRSLSSDERLARASKITCKVLSIFSVHSPHFEFVFSTREIIEIVLQTIQANQFSRSVPRPALNRLYVLLLVINCWSGPIVHVVFPRDAAARRVLFIFSDIVLTIISIVVIPTFIFSDYAGIFDPEIMSVPTEFWSMDAPTARLCSEASVVLLKTDFDVFMGCALALCTIIGLQSLQGMIKLRKSSPRVSTITKRFSSATTHKEPLVLRTINVLKIFHGVIVLVLHIHASTKTHPPACLLSLEPWATVRPACAVYSVNCAKLFDGQDVLRDIGAILEETDPKPMLSLVFHHCQNLIMPPNIKKFTGIIGLKAYNVTIEKWDDDAAITHSDHPNLRYCYMLRTQFADQRLPAGLRSPDFPQLLTDVEIVHSNLATLPEDLDQHWVSVTYLLLDFTLIPEIPSVVLRLPLIPGLSLSYNNVTGVSAELLSSPTIRSLWLIGNPITELPSVVDPGTSAVTLLDLSRTNLSKIPPWMDNKYLATRTVIASGTPLCSSIDTDTSGLLGRSSTATANGGFIECDEGSVEVYPMAFEDRQSTWPQ